MSQIFPSGAIAKKFKRVQSADGGTISSTITVPAQNYGVVYRLWLDLDVTSETDLEILPAKLLLTITIGSVDFKIDVHPKIEHTSALPQEYRTIDLGPWPFDFGSDGLYSGVKGDDIVIAVLAAGSGVKTQVNYIYSGD